MNDDLLDTLAYLLDPDVTENETKARLAETGGTPAGYIRVYWGPRSRIAHLVPEGSRSYGDQAITGCGKTGTLSQWFGTGTEDEADQAFHLPTCQRCRDAVAAWLRSATGRPVASSPVGGEQHGE